MLIWKQNKEIIFQSPASTLLHEFGHGVHYVIVGKDKYEDLHKQSPLDSGFQNKYSTATRLEEIIVIEYENPATKKVGEGIRNRYHGIFHDVSTVTSIPIIKNQRK